MSIPVASAAGVLCPRLCHNVRMDNLSHSFVGLAVGEFVQRSLPAEAQPQQQRTRRRLLLVTCWAASNFPDLDLLLTPLLPAPLGYLLHHRGHTHTLLYALPQALLLWLLLWMFWPAARALLRHSAAARSGLLLTLATGLALHLAMDFLNSYGIHPFHPFDSRWLYGDMVFIVEPVFWMAFGVPMIMMLRGRVLKVSLLALLVGVPLYFTTRGFLSGASLAALIGIAAVAAAAQQRAGAQGKGALMLAMAIGLGFIGMQGGASLLARDNVAQALHRRAAENRLFDAAMTAFPSNPLCWSFVSIESEASGNYVLRRGIVSSAPAIAPASACPPGLGGMDVPAGLTPAIAFTWEERGSIERLRRLKAENCFFDAWLRFARAPSVSGAVALDARFATAPRGNFTALELARSGRRACPQSVPPWDYPRADLLAVPAHGTAGAAKGGR